MGLQPLHQTLTSTEKSLLHKGPNIAIYSSSTPMVDYITTTKLTCHSIGENNLFQKTDSNELLCQITDVLTKFTAKSKPIFSNITKEVRKAYTTLEKTTAI